MSADARNSLIAWGVVLGLIGLSWLGIVPGLAFWTSAVLTIVLPLLIIKGVVQTYRRKARKAA